MIEEATIEVVEVVMEGEEVAVAMVVEVAEETLMVVAEGEAAAVIVVVAQALGVEEEIALQPARVV